MPLLEVAQLLQLASEKSLVCVALGVERSVFRSSDHLLDLRRKRKDSDSDSHSMVLALFHDASKSVYQQTRDYFCNRVTDVRPVVSPLNTRGG